MNFENLALDFLSSIKILNKEREKNLGDKHVCKCCYCSKTEFYGYRYKCLKCYNYDLCNVCFEKRKFSESHQTSHILIRFGEPDKSICGTSLDKEELDLDNLKEKFSNSIHLNIKCNICKEEPIKGLRFKCDSCFDFNVCLTCSKKSFEKHFVNTHPLIVYFQSLSNEINLNEVKMGQKLGSGGFGSVCKASYKGKIVACKKIHARKQTVFGVTLDSSQYDTLRKSYIRELEGYNEIKGENILRMIGHCSIEVKDGHDFIILTELMKTDLEGLIKNEPNISHRKKFSIASGIVSGMTRIHSIGYIHRDIRSANVMVTVYYVAKIGDMGIARIYEDNAPLTLMGARAYMPPEFYTGQYTNKLDVFTVGLTLNELFGGKHVSINREIKISKKCEIIWDDIVSDLVDLDPNNRPKAKDIEDKLSFMNAVVNENLISKNSNYASESTSVASRNEMFRKLFFISLRKYKEVKLEKDKELEIENRKKQKIYFEKKLAKEEDFNPKGENSQVPQLLNSLRFIEYLEKNNDRCLDYCQKRLDRVNEIYKEENHKEKAVSLAGFGFTYLHLIKDPKLALSFYEKAVKINVNLFGEDSFIVSHNYYRIGICFFEMDEIAESLKYHMKSLEIRRSLYDSNSPILVNSLEKV
jgi:serine/threonine protein kinase